MQYTVKITLQSPTLVGDRREPSAYFLPSRDYIPGGVLRAALARAIKDDCPYETGEGLINWVEFVDGSECSRCSWRFLCSSFAELRFHNLYLDGARVAPLSAYRCKLNGEHPVFDTLLFSGRLSCPECKEPAERAGGYLKDGCKVEAKRRLIMRLEVDPYRGVAQDSQLYSLRVLREGQVFSGLLTVPDPAGAFPAELELRIGAKTTAGLGKARVHFKKAVGCGVEKLKERIIRFQEKARELLDIPAGTKEGEFLYLSFTMLADALPEKQLMPKSERVPNDTLQRELIEALLPAGSPVSERLDGVVKVLADFKVYGGYRTAERGDGRRQASLHVSAGSVFLCRVRGPLNDELLQSLLILEEQGLGMSAEDGYGAVRICDEIHLNEGRREV